PPAPLLPYTTLFRSRLREPDIGDVSLAVGRGGFHDVVRSVAQQRAIHPKPHIQVAQLDQVSDLGGVDERDQARLAIARAGAELRHAAEARARPLDHAASGLGDAVAARLEAGRVLDQIDTALQARRKFAARHGWLQELTHDQPLAASAGVRASRRARDWLAACSCAWDRAAM